MGSDRARPEDPMLLKALDHAQARFVQAVIFVGFVLRHVDVEARSTGNGLAAQVQGRVGKRQAGMQAEGPGQTRTLFLLHEADVFRGSRPSSGLRRRDR